MKNQYVNRLQEGDRINDYFVAARKDLRSKQDGGKFLGMVLKDKTGDIGGVMWNNAADAAQLFGVGDVVGVRGVVGTYQGRLQVRIEQAADPVYPFEQSQGGTRDDGFVHQEHPPGFNRLDGAESRFGHDRLHGGLVHGTLLGEEHIDLGRMGEQPLLAV